MILPPIAIAIRHNNYQLAWFLEPHQVWLVWSSLGVSVALFLGSFALRVASKAETIANDSDVPASTSSELQAERGPIEMDRETTV